MNASRKGKREDDAPTTVTADQSTHPRQAARSVAARALRESEQLLRQIMDGLSPSVFVGLLTVDGILTYANRAALDAIGTSPEQVLGKPFEDTPWWSATETSRQRLRMAIEAGRHGVASRFDVVVKGSDGGPAHDAA